jgi:hypothetical protein
MGCALINWLVCQIACEKTPIYPSSSAIKPSSHAASYPDRTRSFTMASSLRLPVTSLPPPASLLVSIETIQRNLASDKRFREKCHRQWTDN